MNADLLLRTIAGDDTTGLIEVRCRRPRDGKITAREWFPVGDISCDYFIAAQAPSLDVYVGVAPRMVREGGRAAIGRVWCLWADCDTHEAGLRLMDFDPQPTLVILSGTATNVHAYWALSHPLAPAWAERANRRIAHALGADLKCADAARILRPPKTLNHKHDPPVRVEIAARDTRRLTAAEVVMRLPDPRPETRKPSANNRPDMSGPLLDVSSEGYYEALTGWEASTSTHVRCPFWDHRSNPAMMLYDGGTWHCFACGAGGSVIEFGAALWGYQLPVRGESFVALRDRLQRELGVV